MKLLIIIMAVAVSVAFTSSVWALGTGEDVAIVDIPTMTEVEAADYAAADIPADVINGNWSGNRRPAILEELSTSEDASAPFSYTPSF